MPARATARGAERPAFAAGERADVLICGASFAGLAVARELAGSGADVLVLDRYDVGERATSACAIPTPWLDAMGLHAAGRQVLPDMTCTTPHGTVRFRLPWTWTAFDYQQLCELLWEQNDARFEHAVVHGRTGDTVHTDRGDVSAPLVVDACGWRRVLGDPHVQPPDAPITRGLEVHPHDPRGDALDLWVDPGLVRRGYGWSVPAAGERRVGTVSYDPTKHVKQPTQQLAAHLGVETVGYQGNWLPHRLRAATEGTAFCVGDSAGHCLPLSGEGIRTAFYFGIAAGRELRAVVEGRQDRDAALAAYERFHERHRGVYELALRLQRLVPALPPRLLTAALRVVGTQRVTTRAFSWYLEQASPTLATTAPRAAVSL